MQMGLFVQERDADLQQAHTEAQSSEIAIQAFRAKHQETCERCGSLELPHMQSHSAAV